MLTYTITGATSFIGIELCRLLLSQGNKVYAVCRKNSPKFSILPSHAQLHVIHTDLQHISSIKEQITHSDLFINLAWGGTSHAGRDDFQIHQDNVQYTLESMRVAREIGCHVFVESGSQAEYGYVPGTITEEISCNPETEYGKAKLEVWEKGKILCNELGLKYIHLRIFSLYGENDHPWTLISTALHKMLRNEPLELSPCTQFWNFLYVGDAALQISKLCQYAIENQHFHSEIYNIASEDTRVLKEFIEEIKHITQTHSDLLYGKIIPARNVSLRPSIKKLNDAIGTIHFTDFAQVIRQITSTLKKEQL